MNCIRALIIFSTWACIIIIILGVELKEARKEAQMTLQALIEFGEYVAEEQAQENIEQDDIAWGKLKTSEWSSLGEDKQIEFLKR